MSNPLPPRPSRLWGKCRADRLLDMLVLVAVSSAGLAVTYPWGEKFAWLPNDWSYQLDTPLNSAANVPLFAVMLLLLLVAFTLMAAIHTLVISPMRRVKKMLHALRCLRLDEVGTLNSTVSEIDDMAEDVSATHNILQQFRQHVPRAIAAEVIRGTATEHYPLRRRRVTLFCSDIEGFKKVVSDSNPDDLGPQLNEYFDLISTVVEEHGGAIDQYMGDKVLACWGAPHDDDEQAVHACQAALMALGRIEQLNTKWAGEGRSVLRTRIGIHTGDALVGNLGGAERVHYSLTGDPVEVVLQLKDVTRQYGTRIVLSESSHAHLAENFLLRPLDVLPNPEGEGFLTIYGLVGTRDSQYFEELNYCISVFSIGFRAFWARDFRAALQKFLEVSQMMPSDPVINIYVDRSRECLRKSPGPNWDALVQTDQKFMAALAEDEA